MVRTLVHGIHESLYKGVNAAARIPGLGNGLNHPALHPWRERLLTRYVAGLPDRRYLESEILPAVYATRPERVLFVGCAPYTRYYHDAFARHGISCWTTDIRPENARWGNPEHHWTGDIADIGSHVPAAGFDMVLFNGVMGYGVTGRDMERIAPVLKRILRVPGYLLIGWNRGLVEDPLDLPCITTRFSHSGLPGLPARRTFRRSTHVFDGFANHPENEPPPAEHLPHV